MIAYDPKSWWGLIFKFHKSDTFRMLLPAMMSVALYSAAVAYVDYEVLLDRFRGTSLVHSLLGFIISLLLVFRTNTAYERWWEGRRQWGALVNASRNLALKLNSFLGKEHPSRSEFQRIICRYALALKEHLRTKNIPASGHSTGHVPNQIASRLFSEVDRVYRRGDITDAQFLSLNPDLSLFIDICGGCERIKKTPIPYSYSLFIKKFIFVYIVTMPLCFVHDFGYWTVLFSTFVFYVLASLELIAEEIENPFGDDANDLPTDEISNTICLNVSEILLGSASGKSP